MAKVKITGIDGLEGEYELDLSYFTNRELHTIKTLTQLRGGELEEALESLDNDIIVGLAMVALNRAGRRVPEDLLWDAPVGRLVLDASDEAADAREADAGPPVSDQKSEPNGVSERPKTDASSGNGSGEPSDLPASDLSSTGPPGSATGAA